MANITAADVNKLRKKTGAGMMDCKNALVEADGDFEEAVDALRKKGQKVAAKRGDREASEGVVIADTSDDGKTGFLISLNCETDFVAKNDDFKSLAEDILKIAKDNNPADLDALKGLPFKDAGQSIEEKIVESIGKIGEKIELGTYEKIDADEVVAYNHPGNNIASLVGLNKSGDGYGEIAKHVAMQVAAMSPVAVDKESVSKEVIDRELQVGREQAIEEGKPENIVDKIAEGKLNKFFKENTLLNQQFIRDTKKTVSQYLKEQDKELTVVEFKRISLTD